MATEYDLKDVTGENTIFIKDGNTIFSKKLGYQAHIINKTTDKAYCGIFREFTHEQCRDNLYHIERDICQKCLKAYKKNNGN
jgi:hypothetical protein